MTDFEPKYARSLCKVCEDKVEMVAAFTNQCRQASVVIEHFSAKCKISSLQEGSAASDYLDPRQQSADKTSCKGDFYGERGICNCKIIFFATHCLIATSLQALNLNKPSRIQPLNDTSWNSTNLRMWPRPSKWRAFSSTSSSIAPYVALLPSPTAV